MRPVESRHWPHLAFLASYPPRECGIATFTRDLAAATPGPWSVIAVDEPGGRPRSYAPEVRWRIDRDDPQQYVPAADWINRTGIALVNLQHEYGLFGGPRGEFLLRFLQHVQCPVVTTLHTVLPSPDAATLWVTRKLIEVSDAIIVLTESALGLLRRHYGPLENKAAVIPHGIPSIPSSSGKRAEVKAALGLKRKLVLATFGLINPGKGIEYAIQALPQIVRRHPDVAYLVIGETHPGIRAQSGEAYRESLHALTRELGVERHVQFVNRYLSLKEVVQYLMATDIYLMSYLEPNQIVSGTLAYALGAGRAVVATPFAYAREVLSEGRGQLVPFRDSDAIARATLRLLADDAFRLQIEARAYAYTRDWLWPEVARQYQLLTDALLASRQRIDLRPGATRLDGSPAISAPRSLRP